MPKLSRWSVSWARVAIALAIVFGLLILLEMWVGPYYEVHLLESTELEVFPTPLPDLSNSNGSAFPTEHCGLSFFVPWSETENSKRAKDSGELIFSNGPGMFVSRPPSDLDAIESLKSLDAAALRIELGREALTSDFALSSAAIATSAKDAKWWHTPFYNRKVDFLLNLKMGLVGFQEGFKPLLIHKFTFGHVRGFQVGDPQRDLVVRLIIFGESGQNCRIELLNIKRQTDISQSEINRLISSLEFKT